MSSEQHHLSRTRIGPDVRRERCAETSVRNLYPHRLAGDLYILVAPVELISLARMEGHRDEGRSTFARILPARHTPARRIAAHRIIGPLEPLAHQQVVDTRHPQPIAAAATLVLLKKHIEPVLIGADPRQRLDFALIVERRLRRPDRLADYLPR